MKFKWDGELYDPVEKTTIGDVSLVERNVGLDIDDWSRLVRAAAGLFWAVRHGGGKITWEQIEALTVDDLEGIIVPGESPAAESGKAEGGDPLAGGSPATSASSGSRAGRPAAGGRTKTAAKGTSSTSPRRSGSRRGTSTA